MLQVGARHSQLLRSASLLLINTNGVAVHLLNETAAESPLTWLREYAPLGLHMRMAVQTSVNAGYYCGELQSLAASVRIWSLFPWVLYNSGPDTLPTPHGMRTLEALLARSALLSSRRNREDIEDHATAAARVERAAASGKHHAAASTTASSSRVSTSFLSLAFHETPALWSMDMFLFKTAQVRLPEMDARDGSIWAVAAERCIQRMAVPPEVILPAIVKFPHSNLSYQLVGVENSTAAYKQASHEPQRYDLIWHTHNKAAVARWLAAHEADEVTAPRTSASASHLRPPHGGGTPHTKAAASASSECARSWNLSAAAAWPLPCLEDESLSTGLQRKKDARATWLCHFRRMFE